jgi:hypothetical protein
MLDKYQNRLRSRGSYTAAAFLQALPELVAAVAAGMVVFRLLAFVAGETALTVLRVVVFALAALYWGIRFSEYRKEGRDAA